jgi:leucyl aminopeptidase
MLETHSGRPRASAGAVVNTMAAMDVEVTTAPLPEIEADVRVLGLTDGQDLPPELAEVEGADDVRTAARKTTLLRPHDARVMVVGLGPPDKVDAEALRVAAAVAAKDAGRFDATSVAWGIPEGTTAEPAAAVAALTEGTILAGFRFDRFRSGDPDDPEPARVERLILAAGGGEDRLSTAARTARVAAEAANRARELQSLPANVATPSFLAERAREISSAFEPVAVEVFGRERISELGMGGLEAVSKGSAEEPQFIVLRYAGGPGGAPTLGLVGKAVTFDTGGISIKPSAKMEEMKMDMSGGAAVLETVAAIAELELGIDLVAVVPSTENMPSGTATRPGDIITQLNGKTVEVNNTDAEGRLILADALTYCTRELEAERVVDLATLTGAIVVALGSTYAGLMANDDEWASQVAGAGGRAGELAWRLPLHPEFKDLTKGTVADLTNSSNKRKAGSIYAAEFLEEFVEGKPWVHLDIAGTAWDVGREYVGSGPTGFGVRLLVELARERAGA